MNFLIKSNYLITVLFLSLLVAGCGQQAESGRTSDKSSDSEGERFSTGTHLDPDPLEIIGAPVSTLYYDVSFEYEFGAAGGDGVYRYRYIKNPELDEDENDTDPNTLDFNIESDNGAKPAFRLRGTPRVPEGADFDSISPVTMVYGIELSDGRQTTTRKFSVNLIKNTFSIGGGASIKVQEGTVRDDGSNLFTTIELGGSSICEGAVEQKYTKRVLADGRVVVPMAIPVNLDRPPSEPVTLFYRISSRFDENSGDRSPLNTRYAKPDVDFIEAEKSVVFNANQVLCVIVIDTFDDEIIEGDEELEIEFFASEGANVDFKLARSTLTITDNEPNVNFEGGTVTRNAGDSITSRVSLASPPVFSQVSTVVGFQKESEPYDSDLFNLNPFGGRLDYPSPQQENSFSVSLVDNYENLDSQTDPKLIFNLDVQEIFELEDLIIWVNEWASTESSINEEIVALGSQEEKAVSITQDSESNILVGVSNTSGQKDSLIVKGFDRRGNPINLTETGPVAFEQGDVNIDLISVQSVGTGMYALVQVDGLLGDRYFGGIDLAVISFLKEGDYYNLVEIDQFGTEGDDIITGRLPTRDGDLYIYGKTDGLRIDGEQPSVINQGGEDGFIFKYSMTGRSKIWGRFIGTENNDAVVSVDYSLRQLVVLVETQASTSNSNGFINVLNNLDGQTLDEDFTRLGIQFNGEQDYRSVLLDGDALRYFVLVNSGVDLDDNLPTDNGTEGFNILGYRFSDSVLNSSLNVTTNGDDEAKKLMLMSDDETFILSGETLGEFEGQLSYGEDNKDIFVSVGDASGSQVSLSKTVQFGTPGEDTLIDIIEAHEGKFMVLWREDYSSGDGSASYRVSPFSVDGEKLTPDPL